MNFKESLIVLRRELHQYPELSSQEAKTAARISEYVGQFNPSQIITQIGGHGMAVCYEFGNEGPVVAIRCELDALPIQEDNPLSYQSKYSGVSHKCGHDGHMSIVAGLSYWLEQQSFEKGKVILLFQPAEETGQGGELVLQDQKFLDLNIDYLFALHNIPGEAKHKVLIMDKGFSAEVVSFAVTLEGAESHAAEPNKGINPASAISKIISDLNDLIIDDPSQDDFAVLTPVHLNMGEKNYGISPAKGELHYTIRTWSTAQMEKLKESIKSNISEVCNTTKLTFAIDWFEYFPASANNDECNDIIRAAATAAGVRQVERPYPFKFGEDFGWFSKNYKTGMFGLGAGVDTPSLHNKAYDFPEELIDTGMDMFKEIIIKLIQ